MLYTAALCNCDLWYQDERYAIDVVSLIQICLIECFFIQWFVVVCSLGVFVDGDEGEFIFMTHTFRSHFRRRMYWFHSLSLKSSQLRTITSSSSPTNYLHKGHIQL